MASYPKYRAPADDGTALVAPGWADLLASLADSPEPLEPGRSAELTIGGRSLATLQGMARRDLLAAALQRTSQYADVDASIAEGIDNGQPLVVSGHQPELFHPGVWFKNFALDALARQSGGVGVHLQIDSDLCRTTSLRVPTGSIESPRVEPVPFDTAGPSLPFEERLIQDSEQFSKFGERVVEAVRPIIGRPLIESTWHHAVTAHRRTANLGQVLSEYRHQIEIAAGARTLEVSFSQVADSEAFRRLVADLILRAGATRDAYNAALDDFRTAHRLRNAAQPLPDLQCEGEWIESPLWVWSTERPTRRALFVASGKGMLRLSDRHGWEAEGPDDADRIVTWLELLRSEGVKIRSRALVTTLFARLILSDLFLHGIGGARYDQVTDRFAERLLGTTPPPHATLTATLRLPIEHSTPTDADVRKLRGRLRDLRFHGEHYLEEHSPTAAHEAAARKQQAIATPKTSENAAERHRTITTANEVMHAALQPLVDQTKTQLSEALVGLRARAILDSREHAFCLYPASDLEARLARLCPIDRSPL